MPVRRFRRDDDERSIEDEIGGYTPGAGASDRDKSGPSPIGVPEGYRVLGQRSPSSFVGMSPTAVEGWSAQGAGPGTLAERGPRYHEGDQWKPAARGPESIAEMQRALALAGYLDTTERFTLGAWDTPTVRAYEQLLAEANASGLDEMSMLQQRAETVTMGGGGRGGRFDPATGTWIPEPLPLQTTNKADLERAFRAAVIDTMGEGWSQAQIRELVDAYNWEEIRVQMDAYEDQGAFGGAPTGEFITQVDVQSPETFLEGELQRRDPAGYQAGQIVNDFLPAFMDALDGWV